MSLLRWWSFWMTPYAILRVLCPFGFGLLFAILLLKLWKEEGRNWSVKRLSLLYLLALFLAGWLPLLSLSALFQTPPGFPTEAADFLSRFTAPESVLLISLMLALSTAKSAKLSQSSSLK